MTRPRSLLLSAGALLLALPLQAQEEPAPPAPAGEELNVEHPEQVARIERELARIKAERERLSGGPVPSILEQSPDLDDAKLTPVLAEREAVLGLTLEQAIGMALENNPDYLLALVQARSAHESVPQQVATFDPTLSSTVTWTAARQAFFSQNPFSGFPVGLNVASGKVLSAQTVLSKTFTLGTVASLTWTDGRTRTEDIFSLNPRYEPNLTVDITQPLLRGFGSEVNTANIDIATNTALSSDATLAETYMAAVLAVEDAYWGLIRSEEDLRSQQQSLTSSIQFLDDQRKREEHGAGTRLEVTIAKAGVAQRREAVILAESALEAARDTLIRLIRPVGDPGKWDVFLVPLDLPTIVELPEQSAGDAVEAALARRPDYWRTLLSLESARRSLTVAENNALPSLNAIASWRQDGLGGQHHSSWSALGEGRFYTWSIGASFSMSLFLRGERAAARQARLDLQAAEVSLRSLEANVVLEVRGALRDIRTAQARIEASTASRILAEERLAATREMLKAGTAVPRDVLDDLAQLASAESTEVRAYITYRLAISTLRRAQGTLLDPWLEGLDPRVRQALERRRSE